MKTLVSDKEFDGFSPKAIGATCLVESGGFYLFLRKTRRWPGQWCTPGGTAEDQESVASAVLRELNEETGIQVAVDSLSEGKRYSVRSPWGDYYLNVCHIHLPSLPVVSLSDEHDRYMWLSLETASTYDMIPGQKEVLKEFFKNSPQKTHLYLVRHGESEWNYLGRWQGWLGSSLTELGKEQARNFRDKVEHVHFDACYTSSTDRTLQTARIISSGHIESHDGLREIKLGAFEGLTDAEILQIAPQEHKNFRERPSAYKPVGDGETFQALLERAQNELQSIANKHPGQNILVVSHGTFIKGVAAAIQGQQLDDMWSLPPHVSHCSCVLIEFVSADVSRMTLVKNFGF